MADNSNVMTTETDVLVIGGGWAGFFAAVKAKEAGANVTLVDKGYAGKTGASAWNDGHVTIFNEEWGGKLDAWLEQHSELGEFMNNPTWTKNSCLESYERFKDILSWGIVPPTDQDGNLVHPFGNPINKGGIDAIWIGWGDTTMPLVREHALKVGVNIVDRIHIIDLIKSDGVVNGAVGFDMYTADFRVFKAKATVLATGTSSFRSYIPAHLGFRASFDGEAMAYRAGAAVSGMEFAANSRWQPFVDEHPENARIFPRQGKEVNDCYLKNVNWWFGGPPILTGQYTDADGRGYGPFNPYGLMAVHEGKGPLLQDLSLTTDEEMAHALVLYKPDYDRCNAVGIDPTERGLFSGPFTVAEGFLGRHMGGSGGVTAAGFDGETTRPGLFGAGDSYHSGVSGAMYPSGGTGIRVAITTGARAGIAAAKYAKDRTATVSVDEIELAKLRDYTLGPIVRNGGFDPEWISTQISNLMMPYYVFGVRSGDRLEATLTLLDFLDKHISPKAYAKDAHQLVAAHEAKNRILGAKMMLASALFREESRGLHYREDFPNRDDENWLCHVVIEQKDGKMSLSKKSIEDWWPELDQKPYSKKYTNRYRGESVPG